MKKLVSGLALAMALGLGGAAAADASLPGKRALPSRDDADKRTEVRESGATELGRVTKVDTEDGYITVRMPVRKGVEITRDGKKAHIQDIHEGDQVRAAFDPGTDQLIRLDVQPRKKD